MAEELDYFENFVRSAFRLSSRSTDTLKPQHPLESRNIHPYLVNVVRLLFDDGHFAQATFEGFKYVDREVARLSGQSESGLKLMMAVFDKASPKLKLTPCITLSEKDEQEGFRFLFAGSILAIRNPRGHEYNVHDTIDECLDHLAIASVLLRRLESAGLVLSPP